MYKFSASQPVKICAITVLLLTSVSSAYAFKSDDESTIKMNLGSDWKITNTQEKVNVAKVTEYSRHALSSDKEVLLQTTMKKSPSGKDTDTIVKKLYSSTKELMQKNGCAFEDIRHVPQTAGKGNAWGIFWQCAHNKRTGLMFFIDSDPTTMYTFTYKADDSYPLSLIDRNNMNQILKSIQLCYKGKDCVALY
jgi:hypothetical protein